MTYTSPTPSGLGRKTWYTWPIIVPPIIEKGSFLGRKLDHIWEKAWDALTEADRVIIYGYSFPDADTQSRAFFLAAAAMPNRPLVLTVNPDHTSALKAEEIFRPRAHLHCRSVMRLLLDGHQMGIR